MIRTLQKARFTTSFYSSKYIRAKLSIAYLLYIDKKTAYTLSD